MGININFDEARVLVASVDIDKSGDLSLNEFMDLIFNSTDALNVNLKELPRNPCLQISYSQHALFMQFLVMIQSITCKELTT